MAFLACAILAFPGLLNGVATGGERAIVHDGDGNTHELSLSEDSTTTVKTSLGTNVVEVRDSAVFVSSADCDNHDCMRQGSIDAPGRQIICLPHQLWIEIVAEGDEGGRMDEAAVDGSSADVDADSPSETGASSGTDDYDAIAR